MTGPIRGTRLQTEVKRFIVGAVTDAKANGMPLVRSCEILMIDTHRVRRWIRGRDPQTLTEAGLTDVASIAKVCPHAQPFDISDESEVLSLAKKYGVSSQALMIRPRYPGGI